MELKETIEKLESNKEFQEWHKKHRDFFLAHAFVMLDEANIDIWQIGFFNPEQSVMTTFFVENEKLKILPNQEVLKSNIEIHPLLYENVTFLSQAAMNEATQLLRTEFKNTKVVKTFFIIQQFHQKPVYNIACFTQAFKTINIKIKAVDGTILQKTEATLADFS